ncbi:MAG TPA: alanine racemase [Nitrososphaerales archaeon]|nr:alanine racemase [Nitrososphaerales archaeon]
MARLAPVSPLIREAHERVRDTYGPSIGLRRDELVTPALTLDKEVLRKNLVLMARLMSKKRAKLRAHIKVHKSPHIARMQIEAGAIGVGTATVWEAVVMARAGISDVFVINQVVGEEKVRTAALLAREASLKVAVDDPSNIEALSRAASAAGSEIGCLIEVDTGMRRSGTSSPEETLKLARMMRGLPGLRFEGLTGYEGHCSLEPHRAKREFMARRAMKYFVGVADLLIKNGIPCPVLSAAGTATWEMTASNPRITEIQPGSYAANDGYHIGLEPRFKQATTVLATVISRRPDHVVTDVGKKTVGGSMGVLKGYDYPIARYDEEHGIFDVYEPCELKVGDRVEVLPGYTPYAVSYFDAYHVVEGGRVVDIWPVIPRGPEHGGLLKLFVK